ncbi:MAG TPA: DinB family protein [Candidatus Dormibacteraeota bacterium]|jgi:uncharacterized damage-inducible protein DinB|nr:DinB family protein [Candidatus Dormibacteraeota bacterium]
MQTTMTKADLLAALRANGAELAARLREMPVAAFEAGRYENGWSGRQILAHVASVEWTYPKLVDLARMGSAPEAAAAVDSFDIGAYNQRQVDKRQAASIADLIAEFERNRAATIAAVEACDEDLLATHIRSTGGVEGSLAQVIGYVAVNHTLEHVADIAG